MVQRGAEVTSDMASPGPQAEPRWGWCIAPPHRGSYDLGRPEGRLPSTAVSEEESMIIINSLNKLPLVSGRNYRGGIYSLFCP